MWSMCMFNRSQKITRAEWPGFSWARCSGILAGEEKILPLLSLPFIKHLKNSYLHTAKAIFILPRELFNSCWFIYGNGFTCKLIRNFYFDWVCVFNWKFPFQNYPSVFLSIEQLHGKPGCHTSKRVPQCHWEEYSSHKYYCRVGSY